ncbi:hypothetical protein PC120_g19808 [Phytophthora cactorum]|nr:hypothetical protein PC120_g19808 [Phytophthora cactorum]
MNQFLGMTSEWLADIFLSEYTYAINPESMKSYSVDDDELYATLNRDGQSHRLDRFTWMCTCELSKTMKLPRRHTMLYRKHVAGLMTISYSSISARITADISGLTDQNFITLWNIWNWRRQERKKDEDKNLTATQKVEGRPDELEENDQKQHGDSKPSEKWTELSATSKQAIKPFSPRRRVGRPHKDGAADKAKQSRARKEYNKGSKLRNAAREDDVVTVEEFLKARQGPLMELSSFVNTFEVRHVQLKLKRLRVEKVIFESAVIPYMLHETIVREALAMIDRT